MLNHPIFSLLEKISFNDKEEVLSGLTSASTKELDILHKGLIDPNTSVDSIVKNLSQELRTRTINITYLLKKIKIQSIHIAEIIEENNSDNLLNTIE